MTITGTAQEGQTLTANPSGVVTGYQWQTLTGSTWSNIAGATNSTYVVQEADEGNQLRVHVTSSGGPADSAATAAVTDIAPTLTAPVISGTAQEGQTLTATAAVANDSDASVTYQWQADHGSGFVNITGATGLSYVVQEGDEGAQLQLVATSTDSDGSGTTATSAATAAVTDGTPTLSVTIAGTAQEGQTLTAVAIANSDDATIRYQWQVLNGANWRNINGATAASYLVTEANEGHQLRVTATSSDSDGGGTSATSTATSPVIDITPAVSVSISGTAQQRQILTAVPNVSSDGDGVRTTYQWQQLVGSNWVDIAGATRSTYRLTEANEGYQIRVMAIVTDDTGQAVSAASAPTAQVTDITPTLSVTVSGTAQEGRTLSAQPQVASDRDGGAITYQWQALVGTTWTNISGATAATYHVGEQDEGHQLRVAATFTDDTGQTVAATSAATASVADIALTLSVSVSGTALDGQALTAIANVNDADAVISYQWQQFTGGTWTNISGATTSTYAITEANEGNRLRVAVTATDSDGGGASATSAATAPVVDPAPILTIANTSLFVAAGGSVNLPISVSGFDADDRVSVNITGLPGFETITDALDHRTFAGGSVTLSAAEVNSGLTLHSTYGGNGQPVNILTVTATNLTTGERATSSVKTVTVTDPPTTQRTSVTAEISAIKPADVLIGGSRVQSMNLVSSSTGYSLSTTSLSTPINGSNSIFAASDGRSVALEKGAVMLATRDGETPSDLSDTIAIAQSEGGVPPVTQETSNSERFDNKSQPVVGELAPTQEQDASLGNASTSNTAQVAMMVGPTPTARDLAAALFLSGVAIPRRANKQNETHKLLIRTSERHRRSQIITYNLSNDSFDGALTQLSDDLPPMIDTNGDGVEWTVV